MIVSGAWPPTPYYPPEWRAQLEEGARREQEKVGNKDKLLRVLVTDTKNLPNYDNFSSKEVESRLEGRQEEIGGKTAATCPPSKKPRGEENARRLMMRRNLKQKAVSGGKSRRRVF